MHGVPPDAELTMHPFSEEEWASKWGSGELPRQNDPMRAEKMSMLGGSLMTTYRMRNADGTVFAAKLIDKFKMHFNKITTDEIKNEACTLQSMKHPRVIKYCWQYEDADKVGFVMEWAPGGSLADFIQARARA